MGILEYADAEAVGLIVMATHGRTGLDRLLDGSVTEAVVRQAYCPTFSIREDLGPRRPVRRLLVPVDFSTHTRRQVACAHALAQTYDAALDFLHVIEKQTPPDVYGPEAQEYAAAAQGQTVRTRVQTALRELAEDTLPASRRYRVHLPVGYPAAEIIRVAEEEEADVVVMATQGRTGLERFLIGSVAEKVVRTAPCPVLTMRAGHPSPARSGDAPAEANDE